MTVAAATFATCGSRSPRQAAKTRTQPNMMPPTNPTSTRLRSPEPTGCRTLGELVARTSETTHVEAKAASTGKWTPNERSTTGSCSDAIAIQAIARSHGTGPAARRLAMVARCAARRVTLNMGRTPFGDSLPRCSAVWQGWIRSPRYEAGRPRTRLVQRERCRCGRS